MDMLSKYFRKQEPYINITHKHYYNHQANTNVTHDNMSLSRCKDEHSSDGNHRAVSYQIVIK